MFECQEPIKFTFLYNVTFKIVTLNQRKWNTDGNLQRLVLVEYRQQRVLKQYGGLKASQPLFTFPPR